MAEEVPQVSYEDLALIEEEFEDVDTEILRQQYKLSQPAYAKRTETLAKIPNFWPLVFEQAPMEVDGFIQAQDSRIFAESLLNIKVTRPEIDDPKGSPRSLTIEFEFKPNDDFEDTVLTKTFWYRRSSDNEVGLVSEPVKINWKKGKDLTEGLTDGAVALWEARKKTGDMTGKGLPEYTALKEKVENLSGANTSFFTFFGWVSSRRWVSKEESEKANKEHQEKRAARQRGEKVEEPEEEEDEDDIGDSEVEVHEAGEHLAITIAEDIWPNAIKFFSQAQELGDMSDVEFEEDDEEDDDEEGEPVDIRALVDASKKKKRVSDTAPPAKKQKK